MFMQLDEVAGIFVISIGVRTYQLHSGREPGAGSTRGPKSPRYIFMALLFMATSSGRSMNGT
jgi:hypothetical protein